MVSPSVKERLAGPGRAAKTWHSTSIRRWPGCAGRNTSAFPLERVQAVKVSELRQSEPHSQPHSQMETLRS
jgi:hypothetical protein